MVVIAFCSAAATAGAQSLVQSFTVAEAVNEAVQRNLSLLAERANLSIAEAGIISAKLRPNPVLSASADHLDWLGTHFDEVNGAGPQEYAARVDVPFERGRKREFRTEVADVTRQSAEAQFADVLRRLKLDVNLACIDVLEAKVKLQLAQDNLQSLERLVELNERRLAGGAIPPLEVTRSKVAMLQYRGSVKTAELALAEARLKLLPLLGRQPDSAPVDVVEPLGTAPAAVKPDVVALQAAARTSRPDLLALRREEARTQADLRLQVAQGKVDYTLGAEYRRQQGVNGRGNSLGFFMSVPLPIFNRNQGEIGRAEAAQQKSSQTLTAFENGVAGEVATAYQEFESARELLLDIERELLVPSQEARTGVAYMYQAGATSLLDVLDAQRAFNDTMDTYYSAQAAYRRAQARLVVAVNAEVLP